MRYILYARKSSEAEDRQVQSIPDQIRILREIAEQRGFPIVEEITESKSAKAPGLRTEFERMLNRIEQGEADAILCWSVNRLVRNPVDGGRLSWMLLNGVLQCIQTPDKVYLPEDNVLLFSVESATATQYIQDLRRNVKRGMNTKLEQGWFPHRAPEGYLNDLAAHTIVRDPERFDMVQRAWKLLLTSTYTIGRVIDVINDEWGYRTRPSHKSGGNKLSRSAGYRIFTNIFYTGYFDHNGVTYRGKHEPMISVQEFEQVQMRLRGQVGKAHYTKHEFAYTGLMKCARCGRAVTAEIQKGWRYYHCSNRLGTCHKRSIREDILEQRINACLKQVTTTPEFNEVIKSSLEIWIEQEFGSIQAVYQQQQRTLLDAEKMLNQLLEMRLRQLIDDVCYREKQAEFQHVISTQRLEVAKVQEKLDRTREVVTNALEFRLQAQEQFLIGDLHKRREIAKCLGIRYLLEEKEVYIEINPLLTYMLPKQSATKLLFEQVKSGSENKKDGTFVPSVPLGCPHGTEFEQKPDKDHQVDAVLARLFRQVWDDQLHMVCPSFL